MGKNKVVHLINNQYFRIYSTKFKTTGMHDLKAIYKKIYTTLMEEVPECFPENGNHRKYPNLPKMNDLSIVSLAMTAECLEITSENLLWFKINKDYPDLFPNLIHRASFNRRRKNLCELIARCIAALGNKLISEDEVFTIDTFPVPVCRIARERQSKACQRPEWDEVLANKGYNKIMGGYFIGYKIHMITTASGVNVDLYITPASTHDVKFLAELDEGDRHLADRILLGDRAYISEAHQLRLWDDLNLRLEVPYRKNQKDRCVYPISYRKSRKSIEVVFSQYCDEYRIKHNYAKRFRGFEARIVTKVAAKTFKQFWNYKNGNPINKTKHALAA
jgi:hypothetical protein